MSKFAVLTSLLLLSGLAVADIVAPSCFLSLWTFNSLGQNPCTVAAHLLSTCYQGSFTIYPLPPGWVNYGPTAADHANLCYCSTVAYTLTSACGACQGAGWLGWSQFSFNCTKTLPPSTFPNPVPAGTSVPRWALLDPTLENFWNNVTAMATGDSPEVAAGAIIGPSNTSSSSHSSSPTSTSALSTSSASASTSPSPTKGSSSNTGAIVGGVVGGVAAISVAIAAVCYLVRRQRPKAPSAEFVIDDEPQWQLPMDEVLKSRPSYVPKPEGTYTTTTMRPYDPDDPTTFPGYRESAPVTSNIPSYNTTGNNPVSMQVPRAPGYHGLPTV